MNEQRYWATKEIEEIANEITSKFDDYKQWMNDSGYSSRIEASYNAFYGMNSEGTLTITRDENDVAQMNVNHFKSLVKRLHILCTENKVAFQPRAKSSDTKSQVMADLARGIVEYYSEEKDMGAVLSEAVLTALIMLESWVHCEWSINEGYELAVDDTQVIKSGDQTFKCYTSYDVARSTCDVKSEWHIVRTKVNKYNEAALHPEFSTEILSDSITIDINDLNYRANHNTNVDDDSYIYKFTLYHSRTAALPEGRKTEVIAGQVVSDGSLKYSKSPIFNIKAGSVVGTSFADSPSIDLLPLQEALDALFSGTVTNNLNNAVQLIWSADPNLTTRKLSDGQTLVTSATPPQALNLTGSAAENFKMIDLLVSHQQILSGINDPARGIGNPNVKTSGGQALYIATALQFISDLQKGYAALASDVATCLINNIQQFATEELTAYIVGSNKQGQIKKFKAKDILDVARISVELGNPLSQSLAGRRELLTDMMQMKVITDPKQIISFLSTGNLDAQIENDFSDALLIASENEMIKKGEKPILLITDLHMEHINSHKKIFSDPKTREDSALTSIGLEHIMEHIDAMRTVPPDLAAALSGQPLPPVNPTPQAANPNPTVNGARMPNVPQGTPETMAQGYQDQMDAMPEEQQQQF